MHWKRTIGILFVLALGAGSGSAASFAAQGPRLFDAMAQGPRIIEGVRPGRGRAVPRPNNLAPIQEVVEGFYVSRLEEELGLDDAQFAKVLPALRDSLRQRNQLGQSRARAMSALREAVQRGASDQEILDLTRTVDQTDLELRSVQEDFFRSIDPELTPEQRARLRIVLPGLEQRIRNLIERSRNANPPPASRPR